MEERIYNEISRYTDSLAHTYDNIWRNVAGAPLGSLQSRKCKHKYNQLFYCERKKDGTLLPPRYLKNKELPLKRLLAQKEYDKKILAVLETYLSAFSKIPKESFAEAVCKVFEKMPDSRKDLVIPLIASDADYIDNWYKCNPGNLNPCPAANQFETNRGEPVRSKSEYMLANLFDKLQIPYVYESLLTDGRNVMYPDFILLDVKQRRTIYYEHFGKLDDSEYSEKIVGRIEAYQKMGIYLGENLIFSMESKNRTLNLKQVEDMLRHYLLL